LQQRALQLELEPGQQQWRLGVDRCDQHDFRRVRARRRRAGKRRATRGQRAQRSGDPATDISDAQQLVQADGVKALFGPIANTGALAVAQQINTLNVPMVGTLGASSDVIYNTNGSPRQWVHRVLLSEPVQVAALMKYANAKGYKHIGMLYTSDAYGIPAEANAQKAAAQAGIAFTAQGMATTATSALAQALALKAAKPDVIWIWGLAGSAGVMIQSLSQAGMSSLPVMGANAILGAGFYKLAGAAANGIVSTALKAQFSTAANVTKFNMDYQKQFKVAPLLWAYCGYDAALVYFAAVKAAGTFDPATVNSQLSKTSFNGVTGHIAFTPSDPEGLSPSSAVLVKIENQAISPVTSP
jgi:branched-chain amino acid transport system substrate-binding protein